MLLRLRDELRAARNEHENAARAPHERGGADPLDFTEDELELRLLRAELAQEDMELAEVEAALQRIDAGTYGICEATGLPIAPARLRAIPWTRLSKAAADREERARTGSA
jgi:RNA polymerase-binding transcription factor DksA